MTKLNKYKISIYNKYKKLITSLIIILSLGYSPLVLPMNEERKCLANAIYHEARNLSIEEQKYITFVILNRLKHPKFPKTICSVVYEKNKFKIKGKVKVVYQFSWTKNSNITIKEKEAYQKALSLADYIIFEKKHYSFNALYFSKPKSKKCNSKELCHRFR